MRVTVTGITGTSADKYHQHMLIQDFRNSYTYSSLKMFKNFLIGIGNTGKKVECNYLRLNNTFAQHAVKETLIIQPI